MNIAANLPSKHYNVRYIEHHKTRPRKQRATQVNMKNLEKE